MRLAGSSNLLIILLLLLLGWGNSGCSNKTQVLIKVKVQSEIDIEKYKKIAIIPFLHTDEDKNEEWGEHIAFVFRRYLSKSKKFAVLDSKDTKLTLEGEKITLDTLQSTDRLIDLGGELGVDAIISGTYRFYHVSEPRRLYYDRYSTQLQRYITDTVTYFHKTYVLSLDISIVDANTGEIVWNNKFDQTAAEDHNLGTLLISGISEGDNVMKRLATQAALKFRRKIEPHYETEERILVR
jgi:TolB-like protein